MIGAEQLEKLILEAIARVGRDTWVDCSIGELRSQVAEAGGTDSSNAPFSNAILVDALVSLIERGLISFEKTVQGGRIRDYKGLKILEVMDEWNIFNRGSFRLKLTHEGRKALEVSATVPSPPQDELDVLLPLHHRKAFDRDLGHLAEEATREGYPLSLVMIDLDHFKHVNDTHGHPVGDNVLQGVADLILRRVRGKGKAYRYGGEEIALLLGNYSAEESVVLAESIRKDVAGTPVTDKALKITISLGVAVVPDHAQDSESLLKCADNALYQAKRLGRNLVRVSGEPESVSDKPHEVQRRHPLPGSPVKFSQRTVALMVQIYPTICTEPDHESLPLVSEDSLYNGLFEMGVEAQVLEFCKDEYRWNFQLLLPQLYDGRFFSDLRNDSVSRSRGAIPSEQEGVQESDIKRGCQVLLKFAQFLYSVLPDFQHVDPVFSQLHKELLGRLSADGLKFVKGEVIPSDTTR